VCRCLQVGTTFTMSTAGKTYCSTSRQSVSALAGLLPGEIIRCRAGPATLSASTTGKPSTGWQRWSESFGLGVPEEVGGLSLQSIPALRPLSLFRSLSFALDVKQGVRVTGRSAARPDPSIAAEEGANQETNRGGIAPRGKRAPENAQQKCGGPFEKSSDA
jgi:hypothetical protein